MKIDKQNKLQRLKSVFSLIGSVLYAIAGVLLIFILIVNLGKDMQTTNNHYYTIDTAYIADTKMIIPPQETTETE